MRFIEFSLTDGNGRVLPFGTVTVTVAASPAGSGTLASLFDQNGGSISNPVKADGNGLAGFAAANNVYDFTLRSQDGSYMLVIPKQQLFDLQAVANALAAGTVAGLVSKIYSTQAGLFADLAAAANTLGLVYADPTASKNDLYVKVGASGSGSWTGPLGMGVSAQANADVQTCNTQATNAQNSATSAASSASSASTSATNAAASATSAQAAQTAVSNAISGGGLNNASLNAASRTVLAGLAHTSGLPAILTEGVSPTGPGRGGLFAPLTSNLSSQVTGDPQQGTVVPFSSDTSGAHGGWVRFSDRIEAVVEWYGAVGDGVTNDQPAIQAAINHMVSLGGGEVRLGPKKYLCSSALTWSGAPIGLAGCGGNIQTANGTILTFPAGLSGAVNPQNGSAGLGQGSSIRNLCIQGSAKTAQVSMTIASPGVVTWTAHGLPLNTPIIFYTTGALPTGITAGVVYYVVAPAANTFEVATAPSGTPINTSGVQSGTHTCGQTVTDANSDIGVGCGLLNQCNSLRVEDVTVLNFEGDAMLTYSLGTAATNANGGTFSKCTAYGNLKKGFATAGPDSNVLQISGLAATNNWQPGVYENASVGNNKYDSCQFAGNGSDVSSVPILVGPSGGTAQFTNTYKESHAQSTLMFRTLSGGRGQNVIDFAQAQGSTGAPATFTVDDQVGDTEWTVQRVASIGKFGVGNSTTGVVRLDSNGIACRIGAPLTFYNAGETVTWQVGATSGNDLVISSGGTGNFHVANPATFNVATFAQSVSMSGLVNYANDAAAATGGIPLLGLYRNGSVVQIRVS